MTTEMHKAPSVAHNTGTSGDNATSVARYDLSTSEGGRRYVAGFFARELRRHDFARYITTTLAADFACVLAQHLAATGKQQVGEVQGDARAQFEAWAKRQHYDLAREDGDGRYEYATTDMAWEAWEAALAARQPGAQEPALFANRWEMEHGTAPGLVAMRAGRHLGIREFFTVPLYAAPPAQGIDLHRLVPPVWISEPVGGPLDDLTPGQAWRQGFNQCRDRTLLLVEQALGFPDEQQRDTAPGVGNG